MVPRLFPGGLGSGPNAYEVEPCREPDKCSRATPPPGVKLPSTKDMRAELGSLGCPFPKPYVRIAPILTRELNQAELYKLLQTAKRDLGQ